MPKTQARDVVSFAVKAVLAVLAVLLLLSFFVNDDAGITEQKVDPHALGD